MQGVFRKSCLIGLKPLMHRPQHWNLHKILIAPQMQEKHQIHSAQKL
jgi:hypothetical protein